MAIHEPIMKSKNELIIDLDFPPEHAGLAQQLMLIFEGMAVYANLNNIKFGSVVNRHN